MTNHTPMLIMTVFGILFPLQFLLNLKKYETDEEKKSLKMFVLKMTGIMSALFIPISIVSLVMNESFFDMLSRNESITTYSIIIFSIMFIWILAFAVYVWLKNGAYEISKYFNGSVEPQKVRMMKLMITVAHFGGLISLLVKRLG